MLNALQGRKVRSLMGNRNRSAKEGDIIPESEKSGFLRKKKENVVRRDHFQRKGSAKV